MPQTIVEEPILAPHSFTTPIEGSLRGPVIPEFLNRTFVEIFERQVAANPSKVAIVAGDKQLTYAELNERANELARRLRAQGVEREVLVGICIDRSLEMAVGIVGILKSGGAYLPLDPDYPRERLAFMVSDAQPAVIVTKSSLTDRLENTDAPFVLIDDGISGTGVPPVNHAQDASLTHAQDARATALVNHAQDACATQPAPSDLAYVIYTSGSTGTPKGAMIEHANLANYLLALNHELGIRSNDVYLHLASIAFSSSRRQLLLPLSQGATVVIASSEERKDPLALFETIKQRRVTVMDAVPSFWRTCTTVLQELDEEERSELLANDLGLMLSASEPLMSDIPRVWANEFKHPAEHVHMFGQTETAGIVCVNPVSIESDEAERIPIGHPIANTEIHVLDEEMDPCAQGIAGELYIGGAGVGRGYLHRPDLTAEKFVPRADARLYRTGDFALVRADGTLEFAGRRDQQIKIRGFRVELAEVESVLMSHPSIRDVIVMTQGDSSNTTLLAYFVAEPGAATPSDLRGFLAGRLPDYAVPSIYVELDQLPLLPNGKVDRRTLAARNDTTARESMNYVAPRTGLEKELAQIVGDVLRLHRIGIDDNFLELGGNSLLAGLVIARVRRALKVRVPITYLFESPTVRELAARLESHLEKDETAGDAPMVRVSREQPLPLSFSQQRLWFLDQLEPNSHAYNLSHAMTIEGALDIAALRHALNAIVARHEILRTRFVNLDGTPFQKIDLPKEVHWQLISFADLSDERRDDEAAALLEKESRRPFDLATGPLFRALLLHLAPDRFTLLLTMHHIVSDGWSAGILMKELSECYQAVTRGKTPRLPELPIQYADYAVWQRDSADTKLKPQLNYWQQQLADAPPVLNLPTDYPRTGIQTYRGGKVTMRLSRILSDDVRRFSREHGATLFMTFLAIFDVLLAVYSGADDVVVGSPIAGRDGFDTELLVGFFVNTLALRTKVSAELTIRELVERVRETALAAYTNRDVPFEMLVTVMQRERSVEHNPIFQVMFVLQNGEQPLPQLADARVQRIDLNEDTSKFDLSLEAIDSEEIEISISYNADLFESDSARVMLEDFQRLLEAAIANPNAPLSQLPTVKWIPKHGSSTEGATAVSTPPIYVAPRTPIEETLAAIWKEVLNADHVGVDDNFFMLGGHSLMAAQVISRIRTAFDFEMPLRQLFETPTVAGLANIICEGHMANTEDAEFAALLAELDELSDEQAQQQIADEQVAN